MSPQENNNNISNENISSNVNENENISNSNENISNENENNNNNNNNNNRAPLQSHLSLVLTSTDLDGPQELEQAQIWYQQGKALHASAVAVANANKDNMNPNANDNTNDYAAAVQAFQKALWIQELYLGKYHKHTIKTYWRIGRSSIALQDYQRALISFKRALRMAESTFGKAPIRVMVSQVQMVSQSSQMVQVQSQTKSQTSSPTQSSSSSSSHITKELVQDIQDFLQDHGLNEHHDYMGAIVQALELERQGDAFCKAKNYKQAVKHYRQAIRLEETVFGFGGGPNNNNNSSNDSANSTANNNANDNSSANANVDCADITCKLACVYRLQRDYASSTLAYRKALHLYRFHLGEQHPATCGARANLEAVASKNHQTVSTTVSSTPATATGSGKKQGWWGKASSSFRSGRRSLSVQ
jgi:hypothetical protein